MQIFPQYATGILRLPGRSLLLAGDGDYITKKRLSEDNLFLTGNFLSSQAVSSQVLSAFMCLTTVFGMGTGGAT